MNGKWLQRRYIGRCFDNWTNMYCLWKFWFRGEIINFFSRGYFKLVCSIGKGYDITSWIIIIGCKPAFQLYLYALRKPRYGTTLFYYYLWFRSGNGCKGIISLVNGICIRIKKRDTWYVFHIPGMIFFLISCFVIISVVLTGLLYYKLSQHRDGIIYFVYAECIRVNTSLSNLLYHLNYFCVFQEFMGAEFFK